MKKDILYPIIGVVLIVFVNYFVLMISTIIHIPFFDPIGGYVSRAAFLGYVISGIIIGLLVKKSPILVAMMAGGITVIFYLLLELLGQAITNVSYYFLLFVSVIVFSGMGGFIASKIRK